MMSGREHMPTVLGDRTENTVRCDVENFKKNVDTDTIRMYVLMFDI